VNKSKKSIGDFVFAVPIAKILTKLYSSSEKNNNIK
jgi:hypothetical protein